MPKRQREFSPGSACWPGAAYCARGGSNGAALAAVVVWPGASSREDMDARPDQPSAARPLRRWTACLAKATRHNTPRWWRR
jgi:hypothetical protein